jgi:uncharacterized protein (TIGR00725 family)
VITGGYGGVMEGASRGAREAGGRAIGVTCSIFVGRPPNPYLTDNVPSGDLFERSRSLIALSRAFVVLPGGAGTLSELALLFALDRAGCLGSRQVILLGSYWEPLMRLLAENRMLEPPQLRRLERAATPEEAVARLGERSA